MTHRRRRASGGWGRWRSVILSPRHGQSDHIEHLRRLPQRESVISSSPEHSRPVSNQNAWSLYPNFRRCTSGHVHSWPESSARNLTASAVTASTPVIVVLSLSSMLQATKWFGGSCLFSFEGKAPMIYPSGSGSVLRTFGSIATSFYTQFFTRTRRSKPPLYINIIIHNPHLHTLS